MQKLDTDQATVVKNQQLCRTGKTIQTDESSGTISGKANQITASSKTVNARKIVCCTSLTFRRIMVSFTIEIDANKIPTILKKYPFYKALIMCEAFVRF